MQILAHLTKEAGQAIFMGFLLLVIAAVTIVAFVIWGIVAIVRSANKPSDEKRESEKL